MGFFLFVCFSLTHQVEFVLPIYPSVWNHLWECAQSPCGHSSKETWVSLTHPSAIWSPISAMLKFYHVFSYIVLVLGVTTAVNFPLPVLILLESPVASDLQFFNSLFHNNTLVLLAKVLMQKFYLGLNTPEFLLIWTLTRWRNVERCTKLWLHSNVTKIQFEPVLTEQNRSRFP